MNVQKNETEKKKTFSLLFDRHLFNAYFLLDHWHAFTFRLFLEGIAVGLLTGLAVGFFRFLLDEANTLRIRIYETWLIPYTSAGHLLPLLCWLFVLALIGGILYRMMKYCPMASGSGIPQVKGIILGLMRMPWFRVLWVKIFGGALGIGAGLSLGREGPSIQIGAAAAQGFSRFFGRTRMEERYLITSGAAGGLAAAFNAPLAGMMFALEELHRNFSGAVLLPTMTSAITATIVTRFFFGQGTSFTFTNLVPLPAGHLGIVVILAITCGFAGIIFNWGLLHIGKFYNLPFFRNQYMKIGFALLAACFLGFALPQVLGGGNALVDTLGAVRFPLGFLVVLLVGKYIFTLLSYGCGVPGGFFLPLLVLGALLGSVEGNILVSTGLLSSVYISNMIILAMTGIFAASVRSPITGTLLILEMTGDFNHLMALALSAAVAYVTAELLHGEPIYDALLKHQLAHGVSPLREKEQNIVEVPVSSGSRYAGRPVSDLPSIPHSVLVEVRRGTASVIPDETTRLLPGDYLYILTESRYAEEVRALGDPVAPRSHV